MRPILSGYKRFFFPAAFLSFLLFIFVILIFNISKPLNLDETDFANAARIILNDPQAFSKNPELGLWHPPVYIYTLASVFKIFGSTPLAARILGFWFYVLNFILVILICKELFEREERRVVSFIAGALYLINPFIIQYSLLVDIDGGLLPSGILAFSYFFIRFTKHGMNAGRILLLGALFALNLLIKFTTSPLIIAAIFLFYIIKRDYKKACFYSLSILAVGAALAWGIWCLYCYAFKIELLYPIIYTFSSKWQFGGMQMTPAKIHKIKSTLLWFTYWVSPALMLLMILGIYKRIIAFIKRRAVGNQDFLLILAALIWFMYNIYFSRSPIMKYHVVYCILLIFIAAGFIYETLIKSGYIKRTGIILSLCMGLGLFVYYFVCFPDMLLWVRFGKLLLSDFFQKNYRFFMALYFTPFFLVPLIFYIRSRKFYCSVILSLCLLALVSNLSQDIKQTADYTTTPSWGNYGEAGLRQAVDYINKRLGPNSAVITRKDVGYYIQYGPEGSPARLWFGDEFLATMPLSEARAELERLMREYGISYVIYSTYDIPPGVYEVIRPYFTLERKFGNFFVYKKSFTTENSADIIQKRGA